MKKCLWVLLNITFKKDLELLYGVGSSVDILEVKKCTTNKQYIINCRLNVGNPETLLESSDDGLKFLVSEAWGLTGCENKSFVLLNSFDVIP